MSLLKDLTINRPDIFSRHSLELSFKLLRHREPALALEVQNILAGKTSDAPKARTLPPHLSRHCEFFMVAVDPVVVGQIISSLTLVGRNIIEQKDVRPSRKAIILSLLEEWMGLVEWMISESEQSFAQA
ncbi:MAG: hypothetical protein OIF35_01795 [Cellvibrionaceae bacterium]|nr:hypothetical protein [Cellvibrionaceae bacterium]MCV6624759.1 hypothetical protein [Cellvibrionaceae bacterium]